MDMFYLKCFYDLSTCRQSGFGIGAIPWTTIIQYSDHLGLEDQVKELFVDILRTMDNAYINYENEKSKS